MFLILTLFQINVNSGTLYGVIQNLKMLVDRLLLIFFNYICFGKSFKTIIKRDTGK